MLEKIHTLKSPKLGFLTAIIFNKIEKVCLKCGSKVWVFFSFVFGGAPPPMWGGVLGPPPRGNNGVPPHSYPPGGVFSRSFH